MAVKFDAPEVQPPDNYEVTNPYEEAAEHPGNLTHEELEDYGVPPAPPPLERQPPKMSYAKALEQYQRDQRIAKAARMVNPLRRHYNILQ